MTVNRKYCEECSIYPGIYQQPAETEDLLKEILRPGHIMTVEPLINLEEQSDNFRIEVAIPGVRRENIFIYTEGTIVSIIVPLSFDEASRNQKQRIHELDPQCYERHILLPENADTGFVSAEYRKGMLCMHIPKTAHSEKVAYHQVVVY